MSWLPGVLILLGVAVAIPFLTRLMAARPEFPPLNTAPDDPLLLDAMARAKATVPDFLTLVRAPRQDALVKLHFVSSSNQVEHLWAEVLEVISDHELGVRLVTPPVTHAGRLERVHRCRIDDIEDWQVRDAQGRIHGAFTQRAMFAIARRDGVTLPKKLLAIESQYREEAS